MKKNLFDITLSAVVLAGLLTSCATSGGFTDALASIGTAAENAGYSDAAAVLNAGSSVSKAAEDITPEEEYYIGRAVSATLFQTYKPYTAAQKEAYLNKICAVLVANSDKPELYNGYHVKIFDSTEVNAFSTSAGHILISKGLIECADNEDALAAVIAHEIAHVQLQHSLKAIKSSRYTAAALQTANAATAIASDKENKEMADTLNNMVDDVITNLVKNGYSQKQEFQADELALTLMNDAGYNISGMDEMLELMKEKQNGKTTGFYKTHPSPESRIKNVDSIAAKMDKVQDTQSYRTSRFAKAMK